MPTPLTVSAFRWTDSGVHTASPIEPLAFDEAIAAGMSQQGVQPLIHLWIYDSALFLGRRDAKLPRLESALRYMGGLGFGAVLRSSGGACVPLDDGVLNMAVHLPDTGLSIDAFFRLVMDMLTIGLADYGNIQFGEVTGSYCVGDYDFALNGKKIGGMAQRRTRHGSILQLCINVEEARFPRGSMMEEFYQLAGLKEMDKQKPIPFIDGTTIGSLSSETNRPVTVEEVKDRLYTALQKQWQVEKIPFSLPLEKVTEARRHLQERLDLFAYQAGELQDPDWQLPL